MLEATSRHTTEEAEYTPLALEQSQTPSQSSFQTRLVQTGSRPSLQVITPTPEVSSGDLVSPRRQRRRIGTEDIVYIHDGSVYASQSPSPAVRPAVKMPLGSSLRSLNPDYRWPSGLTKDETGRRRDSGSTNSMSSESEEDFVGAAGQLSLNEDEQVRYHGKASGLHLLGSKDRVDSRNEGGIWWVFISSRWSCGDIYFCRRFPTAGVWPPLASKARPTTMTTMDDDFRSQLPDASIQEHLVELYFTYVHPSFPVVHKTAFFDAFRAG
jgi:hypothetical protein